MKKNDITTLIVAGVFIVGALVAAYYLLFPAKKTSQEDPAKLKRNEVVEVSKDIDEPTYRMIKNLSDYGKPGLEDIGKQDLFAGS